MREIRAAALADVAPDRPTAVTLDGTAVVLVRLGERVHALGAACAHRGGPLAEGRLSGARLACPWHGWMYDVRSGRCLFPTRGTAVASYPVRVDADGIWVEVP